MSKRKYTLTWPRRFGAEMTSAREAVARAIHQVDERNGAAPWDHPVNQEKHVREAIYERADAALAAIPLTDEVVEAAARAICIVRGENPDYFTGIILLPDEPVQTSGRPMVPQEPTRRVHELQWMRRQDEARAALEAALKMWRKD